MKSGHMACLLLALLLLCLTSMVSCSRISSDIPIGEQELPDMVLNDARYILGQEKEDPLVMQARTITIYKTEKGTTLEDVSFSRGEGLYGSCGKAVINSDNNHATLSGGVTIHQSDDDNDTTIVADEIVWDEEENSIQCEGEVLVTYGDGTTIRAYHFYAAFDENLYEFGSIIEGTMEN